MKMKRLIAISLVVVMTLALIVPASAWNFTTGTSTTDLIASADKEIVINAGKLPAGTVVDVTGATSDADWKYAYPYTLNKIYTPGLYDGAHDTDVFLMWDNTNLYVKEVRSDSITAHTAANLWEKGVDMSKYTFVLPGITMGATATPVGAVVTAVVELDAAKTGAQANVVTAETTSYTYGDGGVGGVSKKAAAGVVSISRVVDGGYEMETVIPWAIFGDGTFTPDVDTNNFLGFDHYSNIGNGGSMFTINQAASASHNDWDYFAPLYLRAEDAKASEQLIDTSWYTPSAMTIDIYTAGQLRGLSYITTQYDKFDDPRASDGKYICRDILQNKTVNIRADIDLNPNWTVGDDTPPLYVWYDIACLSGTFNGNGHTISGAYMDDVWCANALKGADGKYFFTIRKAGDACVANYTQTDSGNAKTRDRGFFGYVYGSGYGEVKNVVFKNCIIESKQNNVGGVIGVVEDNQKVMIENVYADIDINAYVDSSHNWSYAGGIVGKLNGAPSGSYIDTVVYAGNLALTTDGKASSQACGIVGAGTVKSGYNMPIINTLVCSESFTYPASTAGSHRAVSSMSGERTEDNHVTYHPADGSITGTSSSQGVVDGVRVYDATSYPATGWVNVDESNTMKMPAKVAEMISRKVYIQESAVAYNEAFGYNEYSVRILTAIDSLDWEETGFTVDIYVNGVKQGTEVFGSTKVYGSVLIGGEKITASKLGTGSKYVGAIVLEGLKSSDVSDLTTKLVITPFKTVDGVRYASAYSSTVTYINGVYQD